jgi:hypothetical protein
MDAKAESGDDKKKAGDDKEKAGGDKERNEAESGQLISDGTKIA